MATVSRWKVLSTADDDHDELQLRLLSKLVEALGFEKEVDFVSCYLPADAFRIPERVNGSHNGPCSGQPVGQEIQKQKGAGFLGAKDRPDL